MAFMDVLFPTDISYGAIGGPGFDTEIVVYGGGNEQRNDNWGEHALCEYEVAQGAQSEDEIKALVTFFRVVRGMANTFRFKDWLDYQCASGQGYFGLTGRGTGELVYSAYKVYTNSAGSSLRRLPVLVQSTVAAYRNGSPITVGSAAGQVLINVVSGTFTFTPDSLTNIDANVTKAIGSISNANPGGMVCSGHGFSSNDYIKCQSITGMTQLNGQYVTVTVSDANNLGIGVNTSSYGAYSGSGQAVKHGITQTNPARVHIAGHGIPDGTVIPITGATGMTQVNGEYFTVTSAATNHFALAGTDAGSYGAYTGGGQISIGPQSADTLTFTAEFDVLCRFGTDKLRGEIVAPGHYQWDSIPIMEERSEDI